MILHQIPSIKYIVVKIYIKTTSQVMKKGFPDKYFQKKGISKSFFGFSKLDKKNVQNRKPKITFRKKN
jgi:hypothetical protein